MKPSESLLEYALGEIRNKIQTGEYPPGMKLSTQDISDSLGISRTPVISAINRLVSQGLVEAIPRRGMVVSRMSPKQIMDVLEVRRMMEFFAIKPILQNVAENPELLNSMRELLPSFEGAYDTGRASAEEIEINFHTSFIALAGNDQLLDLYKTNWTIGAVFYIFFRTNQTERHREVTLQHHIDFVKAIEEGSEEKLAAVIEAHIGCCYELLDLYKKFYEN